MRLADRIPARPRILFVGINPGMTSALVNHHFAGPSNRFWRLLHESGITPELLKPEWDDRMLEWGYGLTNLVPRPTPGIDTLSSEEYVAGLRVLRRKIRRLEPALVALIGVTLGRFVFGRRAGEPMALGLQAESLAGARVFVLPNPSGRNAHFSYAQMLATYRALARLSSLRSPSAP